VEGRLQARPKTLADYHTWVVEQQQQEEQGKEISKEEITTEDDLMTDIIMKRLRTSDGLDLDWVEKRFGTEIRKTILKGASLGLELDMAEIVTTTTNYREEEEERDTDQEQDGLLSSNASILRLKDPIGFLYSNYIISSIFAELGYE
jgi:coproporphyrinogen III oxidase-like Fe-S oxidoreductase